MNMSVKIERKTLQELIVFKLQHIQNLMRSILEKWKEENSEDFILKAKNGELKDAEMDAITMRQLLADYDRLKNIYDSIASEDQ